MGQMVWAVMLGADKSEVLEDRAPKECHECNAPYPLNSQVCDECGSSGKYALLEKFAAGGGPAPDSPSGDTDKHGMVGFWVGTLDFASFPLDDFLGNPEHQKAYDEAREAWDRFAPWAESQGYKFGEPRLWLVRTEIA